MRSFAITFVLIFLSFGGFAQKTNNLKSYEYKNLKPGINKVESTVIYTKNTKEKLTSPEYKNKKDWENNSKNVRNTTVFTIASKKSKLRSYEYKNYKPWKND